MIPSTLPERPLIYVVDDDEAVCRALGFSLDLEGFAVKVCRSAETLLAMDLPASDAVLVIDERLPGVSGVEAIRRLRARGVGLPALLVTSHPKASLKDAAASVGVPILEKPLLGETLVAAVRESLAAAQDCALFRG